MESTSIILTDSFQSVSGCYVGLDIGGTKTAVVVTDMALNTLVHISAETDVADPDAFMAGLQEVITMAVIQAGLSPTAILAIGAGIPGLVDPETGMVQMAVNLNLTEYLLGPELTRLYGVPVVLENDVRLAAVGAHALLEADRATSLNHLAYLSIGTGIAAGILLNGRLHRGANGMAGEIGHVVVEAAGELCGCGCRGCLETIVSGPAITRQAIPILQAEGYREPFSAEQVFELARAQHPAVIALLDRVGKTATHAIQGLIMAYDVDVLVLSGGVVKAGDPFLNPIWDELAHLRAISPLAAKLLPNEKFIVWPADQNAGTWGAIMLAQQAWHATQEIV